MAPYHMLHPKEKFVILRDRTKNKDGTDVELTKNIAAGCKQMKA